MVLVSYILYNYVSILQTKFSYGERHEARRGGLQAMPLDQHIEGRHGERQACLKIRPAPMHHLLEVADHGHHGEHRLHQHAILPLPALTEFEVGRIALGSMETGIAQHNHPAINLSNEPLKGVIRDIGAGTRPPYNQPPLVQQQTEFAANNPAVIRHAFAANLLRAATFTAGMDQLDAVGVDDAEHRRRGQEDPRPVLRGLQEAKEPRPFGEAGEQHPIVARQPAIERTIPDAFERMQEPERHHLTGPEVSLGVFGDGAQLLIDLVEQGSDKLHGAHTALLSWEGCHREQRGGVVERLQVQKRELLVCTVLYTLYSW